MTGTPKVRSIEPIRLENEAEPQFPRFLLKDGAALSSEQITVSLPALYLVELADGSRDVDAILAKMEESTGLKVQPAQVQGLLEMLDTHYLLDNERARQRLAELSPRPARHAGSGYPARVEELGPFLDGILGDPVETSSRPRASILPHIDFFRGRESYRAGYRHMHALANSGTTPLTVVILGISHALCHSQFILTKMDFDTPLGVVKTDCEVVDQLNQGLPFDPFLDEYNHIAEHSVEFHAVLLQRLVAPKRPLKIVPILCRSFHEAILGQHSPMELPGVPEFLRNLEKLRDDRDDIHFLASVDLAHMGVQFGGKRLNFHFLQDLEKRDIESLEGVRKGEADTFFSTHQADLGERNYCGTPAIYTTLKLFPEPFNMHRYQQCTDRDLASTVTVCAATL